MATPDRPRPIALFAATAALVVTLLALDLTWLGLVAGHFYTATLGPLQRQTVYWPAALAFYALYVTAVMRHAVLGADSVRDAVWRGARLGLLAYGTYDLTNWAVIAGWPAALVPVDMAWGVVLTASAAAVGRATLNRTR